MFLPEESNEGWLWLWPFALISSSTDLDTWSLTASHEALEMLVDPSGDRQITSDKCAGLVPSKFNHTAGALFIDYDF